MSELDILKNNITRLNAHCQQMIESGHIGNNVSNTIDNLVESSLNIIAGLEKAKKVTPIIPPEVKIEMPKASTRIEIPRAPSRKRKK